MTNKIDLNKLNCMNYDVDNGEEHYYICTGLRGLYRYSKRHNIDFKALCLVLLDKGYHVLDDDMTQIAMI